MYSMIYGLDELKRKTNFCLSTDHSPWYSMFQVQTGFPMAGSEDVRGLAASLGELHVEASPSREEGTNGHGSALALF